MKRVPLVLGSAVVLGLVIAFPRAGLGRQEKKAESADSVKAVKQVVTTLFDNVSQGKGEDNLKLFFSPDVTIVGISRGSGLEKAWQKKAAEVVKQWQADGAVKVTVDSNQVELMDDALAVARVNGQTDFVKLRGVMTLTSEGGSWRIASYVFETRLPDQK